MATLHTAALNHHHQHHHQPQSQSQPSKITKTRARTSVKPILKKLHSGQSEKNSLDLDRAWEEQQSPYASDLEPPKRSLEGYPYLHNYHYFTPTQPPPQRDVSFDLPTPTTVTTGSSVQTPSISHTTSNTTVASTHNRSTSGASHVSIATTNSASGRNGSFVHPFQQTPRTSTPPLQSYATSLASLGERERDAGSRDYSPATITETEDNLDDSFPLPQPGARPLQSTLPHSGYRRPSVGSQRTSSLLEAQPSSLRVSTRAAPSISSVTVVADSPIASSATPQTATPSAMSPLRNSLDMANFRIRSRSDVDTATRQEQVRVARRKFEEKERVKEEKYARAEVRKRERADTREARAAHSRKSSFGTPGRKSSSDVANRPAPTRRSTSHSNNEKAQSAGLGITGHDTLSTSNGAYEDITGTTEPAQPPERSADEVHFEPNHRSGKAARRKTQGTWTAFVLWFRTRLLKLGRR